MLINVLQNGRQGGTEHSVETPISAHCFPKKTQNPCRMIGIIRNYKDGLGDRNFHYLWYHLRRGRQAT